VLIAFRQEAGAVLEVNGAQALQPAPECDPLTRWFGRHLIGQQEPRTLTHAGILDVTVVTF
jgi:hypothetical protein